MCSGHGTWSGLCVGSVVSPCVIRHQLYTGLFSGAGGFLAFA